MACGGCAERGRALGAAVKAVRQAQWGVALRQIGRVAASARVDSARVAAAVARAVRKSAGESGQ